MKAAESVNILEIYAEITDAPKWAALQIVKAGRPNMTVGEAMDLIEATIRKAVQISLSKQFQITEVYLNAAAGWEDAIACLRWAMECKATVAEMRAWRRAKRGEDLTIDDGT